MIIEEYILIGINSRNLTHFKNFGYDVKVGLSIKVLSTHLCEKSDINIKAKCDKCGKENIIKKRSHTKSLINHEYYCCKKCSIDKNIKTNKMKYGVEHTFQNIDLLNKRKCNSIIKYGVDSTFKLDEIKEKNKKYKFR